MADRPFTIDAHIHYALPPTPDELIGVMDATGADMANLVIVPHRQRLSSVPDALMAKSMYPDRLFVFASLDVSVFYRFGDDVGNKMAEYARDMLDCGCDGIKIIEGKPNMRKLMPVPDWDSPIWDPFFSWCEQEGIPILWHVNDPEEFWDEDRAPSWAKERGWLYDESFINNEEQYRQVLGMLKKHPQIKIIFAHFFFMSAQLKRLSSIMDEFPNIMIDLTPGIEMYVNFSKDTDAARMFFEKYSGRIVYGTDTGARSVLGNNARFSTDESVCRSNLIKTFLEKEGNIEVSGDGMFLASGFGFTMHCLNLGRDVLEGIYAKNFLSFLGKGSAPVNGEYVIRDCIRIRKTLGVMASFDKELNAETTGIDIVEKYFSERRDPK